MNMILAPASENLHLGMCAQQRFRSACAFAQSDQDFNGSFWIAKGAKFLHADNEDFDQTADTQADGSVVCTMFYHIQFILPWTQYTLD